MKEKHKLLPSGQSDMAPALESFRYILNIFPVFLWIIISDEMGFTPMSGQSTQNRLLSNLPCTLYPTIKQKNKGDYDLGCPSARQCAQRIHRNILTMGKPQSLFCRTKTEAYNQKHVMSMRRASRVCFCHEDKKNQLESN